MWFGVKIMLIPIFVITSLFLSGFTYLKETRNIDLLLFDACFNYVYNNSQSVTHGIDPYISMQLYSENKFDKDSSNSQREDVFFSDLISETDSNDVELNDSLKLSSFQDSTLTDTVKIDSMALDSTARLEYFRYQREDKPYLEIGKKKSSKFFASADKFIRRFVELDSTGQFVLIKEVIAGEQSKTFLKIPLEQYIELKIKAQNRKSWEDIGYKYEKKEGDRDLSKLLTDITNIEIPLPSSSFLSIFGPNRINLKINGAVDIHGAWRNETTEGVTASLLGNTKNEPDFKQQVQINVNGTVGDKLSISADWNTERTFEFENQLKLKYTGYEDEIIQSIEAGNVSLQTSPLIGGSEALFGVKANFQLGPFTLTALE